MSLQRIRRYHLLYLWTGEYDPYVLIVRWPTWHLSVGAVSIWLDPVLTRIRSCRSFFCSIPVVVFHIYRLRLSGISTFGTVMCGIFPRGGTQVPKNCTCNQANAVNDNFTNLFFLFDYFIEPIQPWRMCYECHYAVSDGRTEGSECKNPDPIKDPPNTANCTGYCSVSTDSVK